MVSRFRAYLPLLLALLLAGLFLHAQVQPVGTVDGAVTDGSGGSLAGVKVTLRNVDTGVARDTLSNESGNYFFPLVNPGRYEAAVMADAAQLLSLNVEGADARPATAGATASTIVPDPAAEYRFRAPDETLLRSIAAATGIAGNTWIVVVCPCAALIWSRIRRTDLRYALS